jgi:hypothetical protein
MPPNTLLGSGGNLPSYPKPCRILHIDCYAVPAYEPSIMIVVIPKEMTSDFVGLWGELLLPCRYSASVKLIG